ncbi:Tyrosine-protein phosphatase, partial [Tetrabaena socialis]
PSAPSSSSTSSSAPARPPLVRHHISLLERRRYYLALAARIPATTTAAALLTNLVDPPAARRLLLPYVNGGGLPLLYEMLLDSARPELRRVLEVLLEAAEARRCVLFFCRAGKDRTGLVAAAVLAVAGASEEQIVADYTRSDAYHRVALAGLERREELAGLDRAAFERA